MPARLEPWPQSVEAPRRILRDASLRDAPQDEVGAKGYTFRASRQSRNRPDPTTMAEPASRLAVGRSPQTR